ncbi:ABC transporter substrate-binding protein [Candidatus Margulisiibacteriota bacterium]
MIVNTTLVSSPNITLAKSIFKKQDSSLKIALPVRIKGLHPIKTLGTAANSINDLIFEHLLDIDHQGNFKSSLAVKWTISKNKLIYTFHLRQNVNFHNGEKFTADNVYYSINLIRDFYLENKKQNNPAWNSFKNTFQNISEIKIIDAHQIQIILKKPNINFLADNISNLPILLNNEKEKIFNIGTGPYKVENINPLSIILKKNPGYYLELPYLDNIEFKFYSNFAKAWASIMKGDADLILFLPQDKYEIMKKDPTFKTFSITAPTYSAILFNLSHPLFSNVEIRQAINYAINKEKMIKIANKGYGNVCTGPFLPGSLSYNENLKPYKYYPEKAIKIFSKYGYKIKNNVMMKNNKPLEITLLINKPYSSLKNIAAILHQQFQEIGIKLILKQHTKKALPQDFELFLTTANITRNNLITRLIGLMQQCNPKKDDRVINKVIKLSRQAAETYTPTIQNQLLQEIHKHFYENQIFCFLFNPEVFFAVRDNYQNIDNFFTPFMPTYYLAYWRYNK